MITLPPWTDLGLVSNKKKNYQLKWEHGAPDEISNLLLGREGFTIDYERARVMIVSRKGAVVPKSLHAKHKHVDAKLVYASTGLKYPHEVL